MLHKEHYLHTVRVHEASYGAKGNIAGPDREDV